MSIRKLPGFCICAVLWLVAGSALAAGAGPISKVNSDPITAKVILGLAGKFKVMEKTFCGSYPGDTMTMFLIQDEQPVAEHPFCSSDGNARAKVVIDANGVNYVLLKYGVGHGTNATSKYLEVFHAKGNMFELARIPLSSPAGEKSRWQYSFDVMAPKSGGLLIRLKRLLVGRDAEEYPSEKFRFVAIGTSNSLGPTIFTSSEWSN